jgi:hypothetical protein
MNNGKYTLTINMHPDLGAAVRRLADMEMLSMSDIARRSLLAEVREHGLYPAARTMVTTPQEVVL